MQPQLGSLTATPTQVHMDIRHRQWPISLFFRPLRRIPIVLTDKSILTLIHLVLGLKHRTWYFCVVMVLGGLGMAVFGSAEIRGSHRLRG